MKLPTIISLFVASIHYAIATRTLDERVIHLKNELKEMKMALGNIPTAEGKIEELEAYKVENEKLKLSLENAKMECSSSLVDDSHCPDNMVSFSDVALL